MSPPRREKRSLVGRDTDSIAARILSEVKSATANEEFLDRDAGGSACRAESWEETLSLRCRSCSTSAPRSDLALSSFPDRPPEPVVPFVFAFVGGVRGGGISWASSAACSAGDLACGGVPVAAAAACESAGLLGDLAVCSWLRYLLE